MVFKIVYQDKALRKRFFYLKASGWLDIIPLAFTNKKAEEKLILIETMAEDDARNG